MGYNRVRLALFQMTKQHVASQKRKYAPGYTYVPANRRLRVGN
jgi:hypothetical protein